MEIRRVAVNFRIRKESNQTSAEGNVDIINLKPETENNIRERGRQIQVFAGYENPQLIFDGDIKRYYRGREGLERISRIHVGSYIAARAKAIFNDTFENSSVREIVRRGVSTYGGIFKLGSLESIPEDATVENYTASGPTDDELTQLLQPIGVRFYEENKTIRFTRIGVLSPPIAPIQINPKNGLIGTPVHTNDNGLNLSVVLNPKITLDSQVSVDSYVTDQNQIYKVVAVTHIGDNWEGDFQTALELRPGRVE